MAITITAPSAGSNVSGTINVTGSQPVPTVVVSDGATQLGSQVFSDVPFSIAVDTTVLTNGSQILTVNDASVTVNVSNGVAPGFLAVDSVASPVNPTFTLTGESGSSWVNVAAFDHATGNKVSNDAAPTSGAFSLNVNLGSLTGTRQIDVIAFSVPAGQPGGTQATVSITVTVATLVNSLYWGVDIHPVQGGIYTSRSVANQKADVQSLGMTVVCADAYTLNDCQTLAALIPQWAPVTLVPELIPVQGTLSGSVSAMYNSMKSYGASAASILAGSPLVVFGNEADLVCITNANTTDGNLPSQYKATQTGLYLAAFSGFCDGWHSVDTARTTKLAINGTYIHTGWLQMLVNGTLPNGSAAPYGAPDVDAYTWHDYQTGGDPSATSGHSGTVNLFNVIAGLTSKPIYLSETGKGDPAVSSSAVSTYINNIFPKFASHPQWKGNWYYELYDYTDGAYGLFTSSAVIKPEGAALKNFITANPR